jgi:hypothetical protein
MAKKLKIVHESTLATTAGRSALGGGRVNPKPHILYGLAGDKKPAPL